MSDGYPSMTALLGLLALAASKQGQARGAAPWAVRLLSACRPRCRTGGLADWLAERAEVGGPLGGLLGNQRGVAPGGFLDQRLGRDAGALP